MKLYHASKHQFDVLIRKQASHPEAEAFSVPEGELQNKIYLTPSLGFAIAMAAGPDGVTSLVDGKISFENQQAFDPELAVYVYEVDSKNISPELLEEIDEEQYAVDMDELIPEHVENYIAEDVFKYYELTPWKHPDERKAETKFC